MLDLTLPPRDDGLTIRTSNAWARDKLAIVECYVQGFSRACSKKAKGGWQIVDGFAGPGVNRIKGTDDLLWGTPLVCVAAEPQVPTILAMDLGEDEVEALRARTAGYSDRIQVLRGDVNEDLLREMENHLSRSAPTLCILDPEGMELNFSSVEAVSKFRSGRTKAEVLILFPTHTGFLRVLTDKGGGFPWAPEHLDRMFGTTRWKDIWQRRQAGMPSELATEQYVQLYGEQLRGLGYTHVLDRQIRERGRKGRLGYYLMFGSQHDAGGRIMDHCFDTRYSSGEEQLGLFPLPRVSHLRR